jgi:hypothetical protein
MPRGPDDGTKGRPAPRESTAPQSTGRPGPALSSRDAPAPAANASPLREAPPSVNKAGRQARLVIIRADGSRDTAWLVGHGPPDLSAIDVLARLLLVCRRQGDRMHLEDVSAALGGLLDLSGLRAQFEREPEPGEQPFRL